MRAGPSPQKTIVQLGVPQDERYIDADCRDQQHKREPEQTDDVLDAVYYVRGEQKRRDSQDGGSADSKPVVL